MTAKKTLGGLLIAILVAVLGYLGLTAADSLPSNAPFEPDAGPIISGLFEPWYDIYFTNPACPPVAERVGGVDEIIADDIRNAAFNVDIVAFDLDAVPIIDALIELEQMGGVVRVVVDDGHTPAATINRLRRNGLSVVVDNRTALMHDKFIVIDNSVVWTGSLNFTSNGVYCNNNTLVRFDQPELAANYVAEVDEMYEARAFGPTSPNNTPYEAFLYNDVTIENYFSPETTVAPIITDNLYQAQSEILFMAFSFTNENIGEALLNRADDGIEIRGVFETSGSETAFSYFPPLRDSGLANVEVRQDGGPRLMHHKVFIIDRETVIFGSYNFTSSGNDVNDENILIVHDSEFASFFVEEFELIWDEAADR